MDRHTENSKSLPQQQSDPTLRPADEIDLVYLGMMFWRRRLLIVIVAGVLILASLVLALLKKPVYDYTASIQLGSMLVRSGVVLTGTLGQLSEPNAIVPLMSPASAADALRHTYIPNAIHQYKVKQRMDFAALNVNVGTIAGSDTVTLSCKASEKLGAACIAVEKLASADFIKDNSRTTSLVNGNLQAKLDVAKLDLKELQDPSVFGVQKLQAENAIAEARNKLDTLQAKAVVLKVRKNKLHASTDLYQKQAAQLQAHIAGVRKSVVGAARGTSDPTSAMANLLLSTEEQRSVNLHNQLERTLNVTLPEELAVADKDLADNVRAQALQKQVIQQSQLALQKFLSNHNRQIQMRNAGIAQLQSQRANLQDNRMLGDPLRSMNPVGIGRATVFGIGIILSCFIAFFAALFAGYAKQVQMRLRSNKPAS